MRHQQNRRSRSRTRKGPNPLTRSFESNGPDVKVRGTAAHIAEKYVTLARDAQSSGDIVAAENYLQHAEHYTRIVMAAQAQFQPVQQTQFRDDEGYDDERSPNGRVSQDRFEYNGEAGRNEDDGDAFEGDDDDDARNFQAPEPARGPRPDDRERPQGPRPDRYERNDRGYRGDRNNGDRNNNDRNNGDRNNNDRNYRGDRPQHARGPERDDRGDRGFRSERDYRGGERPDRGDGGADRDNRGERVARDDRGDRNGRDERNNRDDRGARNGRDERPERDERSEPVGQTEAFDERVAPTLAADMAEAVPGAEAMDEAPAKPARRRRAPRPAIGADQPGDAAADVTPDGAAALVAFPD